MRPIWPNLEQNVPKSINSEKSVIIGKNEDEMVICPFINWSPFSSEIRLCHDIHKNKRITGT